VVAGFQGVHPNDRTPRITTLGRGGSDMTAVVLASVLNADFCDIYTDVSGVFTADPRLIGSAQKIHKITFEEMQILADHGAKVLQPKCVAYAFEKNVRLRVLSSFDTLYTANEATLANTIDIPPSIGTEIIQQERTVDRRPFSGIAHSFNQAKISLVGLRETHIKHLSAIIADTHIHIEGLSQSLTQVTKSQYANIVSFLVTKADLVPVIALLKKKQQELGFSDINVIHNIVKISLVGYGFQQKITSPANLGSKIEPNLGSKVLKTLNDNQIFAEVAAITHMTMTLTADEHHARPIIQLLHDHLIRETA
ncbi:MAG: hypothetical protein K2X98_00080, partial [Alphaproteobacteria bacterium]|nr:hypothetical protein [Alphaproteobacteria bacterium]